jgi:hypothetical protein
MLATLHKNLGELSVLLGSMAALVGCSRGPGRFEAPEVDAESAAARAMELYDANDDAALNKEELAKCPGILAQIKTYDQNANSAVEEDEIRRRLSELLKYRTGATGLNALVLYNGRPLSGATVVLEPEPYLGDQVQKAEGVTDGAGSADLGIPQEFVPEHLRRIKCVHYGTFKVRVTHPTVELPAKYNTATELGYETQPGDPYVRFALSSK